MALDTRSYGHSGDRVTVIGLGGTSLSKHSLDDGVATVHRALELGVTYFDTSPGYAKGINQAILGYALEGRSEDHIVATKLAMRTPARFRSYEALRAQLDENLTLLRRDTVDVLQVHESDHNVWWTDTPPAETYIPLDPDYDFAEAPVVQVIQDAKSEGLCRYTGVTGNTVDGVGTAFANVDVDVCLTAFNYDILRRRSRRELIPLARSRNANVVLGAVIRLTDNMPEQLEKLRAVSRESGISVLELTLRYLLADHDVTSILVGASIPAEIEESVGAAEKGPLPSDLQQTLEELGDHSFLTSFGRICSAKD